MPFLEFNFNINANQQADTEKALELLGALSITLRDADAETPDEQAIFEPGVGEEPLWSSMLVSALFDADHDYQHLRDGLLIALPWLQVQPLSLREVADAHWERAWMDQFRPMRFGRRLWIYPWNIDPPRDQDQVIVRLDPGLAFGSGTHPTTALCLEYLDSLDLGGKTVTDYGCGSGVLGIAALKLGASRVVGVDHDPQALNAACDNARRNHVDHCFTACRPHDFTKDPADVMLANILASALDELAPTLATATCPGATLVISGILHAQQEDMLRRYAPWFEALSVTTREDWVCISGRRFS